MKNKTCIFKSNLKQKGTTLKSDNDSTNIIDFETIIKKLNDKQREKQDDALALVRSKILTGAEIVRSLSLEDNSAVAAFFSAWLEAELSASLGLTDDPEGAFEESPLFDITEKVYQKAAAGCYFCDHSIDPNEMEINAGTHLCMMCELKLANFVTAMGVDPLSFMPGVLAPRTVQKTRIKRKKVNPGGVLCRPKNSTLH